MSNLEDRHIESLIKVDNFGKESAADFPANSVGGRAFAAVAQAVRDLNRLGAVKATATDTRMSGTARKAMAREELYDDLLAISGTARTISLENEVFINKFRMPRTNRNDSALLEAARAFAAELVAYKADFVDYGLPEDFIEDLEADIEDFENAYNLQDSAGRESIDANAEIDAILDKALIAKRQLMTVVKNTYRSNAGKLAQWKSASHVERSPRKSAPPAPTA